MSSVKGIEELIRLTEQGMMRQMEMSRADDQDASVLFDVCHQIAKVDLHQWFKKVNSDLAYVDWMRKSEFQGYKFCTWFKKEVTNGKAVYHAELVVLKDDKQSDDKHYHDALENCLLYVDKTSNVYQANNKLSYDFDYDMDDFRLTHLGFLAPAWEILKLEQEIKSIMCFGFSELIKSGKKFSNEALSYVLEIKGNE